VTRHLHAMQSRKRGQFTLERLRIAAGETDDVPELVSQVPGARAHRPERSVGPGSDQRRG
jgi:hypothetical protein